METGDSQQFKKSPSSVIVGNNQFLKSTMHFGSAVFIVVTGLALLAAPGTGRKPMRQPSEAEVQEWRDKLIGKKLVRDDAEDFDQNTQFRESDLPSSHRIIGPDDAITKDRRVRRLNVDIDENNIATNIGFY